MGIGYVRAKKVIKKECAKCATIWDDEQIQYDNGATMQHGYGDDSCPFCHAPWKLEHIFKIPKLKLKRDKTQDSRI
jgi:hypothetical protein